MTMESENNLQNLVNQPYKYGFSTLIETEALPPGLNEEVIKLISKKNKVESVISGALW